MLHVAHHHTLDLGYHDVLHRALKGGGDKGVVIGIESHHTLNLGYHDVLHRALKGGGDMVW